MNAPMLSKRTQCNTAFLIFITVTLLLSCVSSFTAPRVAWSSMRLAIDESPCKEKERLQMFFSEDAPASNGPTVKLSPSPDDEASILAVADFMVNAFWLNSPYQLVESGGIPSKVSDSARGALLQEQARDLTDKYGERIGKRLLNCCLVTAIEEESGDMLGAVGVEVCLFDKAREEIIHGNKAEVMLKDAVASLGPKQRRQYKDSSVQELATVLLPPEIRAISCLSNLAVSPKARKQGIAKKLCAEAERISMDWGYNEIFLMVESENEAARYLYEQKLNYSPECTLVGAAALRADADSGRYVAINADTLILVKKLGTKERLQENI